MENLNIKALILATLLILITLMLMRVGVVQRGGPELEGSQPARSARLAREIIEEGTIPDEIRAKYTTAVQPATQAAEGRVIANDKLILPPYSRARVSLQTYCLDRLWPAPSSGEKLHLVDISQLLIEDFIPIYEDLMSYSALHPEANLQIQRIVWFMRFLSEGLYVPSYDLVYEDKQLLERVHPGSTAIIERQKTIIRLKQEALKLLKDLIQQLPEEVKEVLRQLSDLGYDVNNPPRDLVTANSIVSRTLQIINTMRPAGAIREDNSEYTLLSNDVAVKTEHPGGASRTTLIVVNPTPVTKTLDFKRYALESGRKAQRLGIGGIRSVEWEQPRWKEVTISKAAKGPESSSQSGQALNVNFLKVYYGDTDFGEQLILHLAIKNISQETQHLFGNTIYVQDSEGHVYRPHSLLGFAFQIVPGQTIENEFPFPVPRTAIGLKLYIKTTKAPEGEEFSIPPLAPLDAFVNDSLSYIDKLAQASRELVEVAQYFEREVDRHTAETLLKLAGELLNKLLDEQAIKPLISIAPIPLSVLATRQKKPKDEVVGYVNEVKREIRNAYEQAIHEIKKNIHKIGSDSLKKYFYDLEMRRKAHLALVKISQWSSEILGEAKNKATMLAPLDMANRSLWGVAKILVAILYPPAWRILLADTVRSTLKAIKEINESTILWISALLAAYSAHISIYEIANNTIKGINMIVKGEISKLPAAELIWKSDHIIDSDDSVDAFSRVIFRNTGSHDVLYKLVIQYLAEPWKGGYVIQKDLNISAGSSQEVKLEYTDCEQIEAQARNKKIKVCRGTPPRKFSYYFLAKTESGLYGIEEGERKFNPTK